MVFIHVESYEFIHWTWYIQAFAFHEKSSWLLRFWREGLSGVCHCSISPDQACHIAELPLCSQAIYPTECSTSGKAIASKCKQHISTVVQARECLKSCLKQCESIGDPSSCSLLCLSLPRELTVWLLLRSVCKSGDGTLSETSLLRPSLLYNRFRVPAADRLWGRESSVRLQSMLCLEFCQAW